jgi:phosphoribosylanthranilate isomerase/pentose-5-phosphate-3-epimerase
MTFMKEVKLKICRVNDLDSSKMLVWQGVQFLGMHLISEKDISLVNTYKTINRKLQTCLNFYGSVLVTKIKELDIIKNIVTGCNFRFIQIHASISKLELISIKEFCGSEKIKLILVFDPLNNISFEEYYKYADIIIIDHIKGGTGEEVSETDFNMYNLDKCLIAGGVSNSNIKNKMVNLNPLGFDIQTYTETKEKQKNFENVNYLMEIISPEKYRINISAKTKIISLSLTDLDEKCFDSKILPLYSQVDSFHVDHSTGYFDKSFVRDSLHIINVINTKAKSKPYDLHIFAEKNEIIAIIDRYLASNFRLHIAYLQVENIDGDFENFLNMLKKECLLRRIKLGIALQAGIIRVSDVENLLKMLHRNSIVEISIVGLSFNKSLLEYRNVVLPFSEEVNRVNIQYDHFFSIALDRATTPEKMRVVRNCGINKIFSGLSILGNDDPQKVISQFNQIIGRKNE